MGKKLLQVVLIAMLGIGLSACQGQEDKVNETQGEEAKSDETSIQVQKEKLTITDLKGNTVTFDSPPERIVSLIVGELNTLYDLGAEAVGRPIIRGKMSEAIENLPEVGTSNDVNIEKIASLEPDVVIAHPQLNKDAIPALEEMNIPVLQMGANSVDGVKDSIAIMGQLVQKEAEAAAIIEAINEKSVQSDETDEEKLRTLLIFGSAGNWMVALPTSLSGGMLEAVGAYNIAKDYEGLEHFPQYAQLEMEKIIEADPEMILFVTAGPLEETMEAFTSEMEKNPAWNNLNALKNDRFMSLPNHLFGANPGSHMTASLDYLNELLEEVEKSD